MSFGHSANNSASAVVNSSLWYAADIVFGGQVLKFGCFDHFGSDHIAFHGHLMREQHGSRAMRSGRGDEYLQVDWLGEAAQELTCFWIQARIATGYL